MSSGGSHGPGSCAEQAARAWVVNGQGIPGDGDNLAEAIDVDVLVLVDLGKELVERLGGGGHGEEGEGVDGKKSVGTKKKEEKEKEKEEGKRSEKKRRKKRKHKFPEPTTLPNKEGISERYSTQTDSRFPTHHEGAGQPAAAATKERSKPLCGTFFFFLRPSLCLTYLKRLGPSKKGAPTFIFLVSSLLLFPHSPWPQTAGPRKHNLTT